MHKKNKKANNETKEKLGDRDKKIVNEQRSKQKRKRERKKTQMTEREKENN